MQPDELRDFANLTERIVRNYTKIENMPWDYGNGVVLTRPETQTLMVIDGEPGISVTALAKKRSITKGAASQVLYRLADKGLVEKRLSTNSDAQISLYLTELGEEEMQLHNEYHSKSAEPVFEYLRAMPKENTALLLELLRYFDAVLTEKIDNARN